MGEFGAVSVVSGHIRGEPCHFMLKFYITSTPSVQPVLITCFLSLINTGIENLVHQDKPEPHSTDS